VSPQLSPLRKCFVTLRQKTLLYGRKAARFFLDLQKKSRQSNHVAL
jgi:hypothetical protein